MGGLGFVRRVKQMNDPIVFFKIGRLLINVKYIVAVQEYVQCVGADYSVSCTIYVADGKEYYYPGSQEEFLTELNELLKKAGMCYGK